MNNKSEVQISQLASSLTICYTLNKKVAPKCVNNVNHKNKEFSTYFNVTVTNNQSVNLF